MIRINKNVLSSIEKELRGVKSMKENEFWERCKIKRKR